MAKTNANYSIKVGVDLDTSDIQKQLQEASKAATLKIDSKGLKEADVDAGKLAESMGDVNTAAQENEVTWNALNIIFTKTVQLFSDMIEQVYELDGALTEFKKVSDLSGESLSAYVDRLGKIGETVARTTSEMVQGATEFKKSGFSDEDAAMLAETASMLQNVADEELTAGEAANFLISQMTAFHLEAEDATHVLDSLNEVSNNFAVSSGQLTTSLPLVASALAVGNNEFEEMIGLVTGAVEVTRNASKASRGLVSIQSRLNQVVDESSSTGQALSDWYQKHNIALYDQEGQLRSLYDVLEDVAKQWTNLTTNEKDYYLNQQAGANQTVQLSAILSNFDHVIEATATAYNSAGSAARENARYMESLEA